MDVSALIRQIELTRDGVVYTADKHHYPLGHPERAGIDNEFNDLIAWVKKETASA